MFVFIVFKFVLEEIHGDKSKTKAVEGGGGKKREAVMDRGEQVKGTQQYAPKVVTR